MTIPCPYCGPRDLSEFTYQGDATRTRPEPTSTDETAWHAWVYVRQNPAGWHREYWQHSGGCRAHLVVHRNTLTHEIGEVHLAREAQAGANAPAASVKADAAQAEAAPTRAKRTTRKPKPADPSGKPLAPAATRRKGVSK